MHCDETSKEDQAVGVIESLRELEWLLRKHGHSGQADAVEDMDTAGLSTARTHDVASTFRQWLTLST